MKKIILLVSLFVLALPAYVCADTYIFTDDDLVYFYWDPGYKTYQSYTEYMADSSYETGEVNDALWYYRCLTYFYPDYYKGWWGIIRCYSGNFKDLDFVDSDDYIGKLSKSDYASYKNDEGKDVLDLWETQLPEITKARKERAAAEAKKRADNSYNMKFVRHDGILEQYNGSDPEVLIPEDVTIIGEGAFRQTNIERIVFHKNVKEIQKDAFASCGLLREVVIPSTVTAIGEGAFRQCLHLESAEIPDSIKKMPDNLFQGCTRLKTVTIDNGVKEIGKCFTGCEGLSTILIPPSVKTIGPFAFSGCKNLKTVTIMSNEVSIGKRAFYGTRLEDKDKLSSRFGSIIFY